MITLLRCSTVVLMLLTVLSAQSLDVSLERTTSHKDWGTGWDTIFVLQNGIVTLAAVPKIGGRVMQYDLGTNASIYIHGEYKGKVPPDGNAMVGGFRMLPSPQADFGWPSPPALDLNPYTCTVVASSADSAAIELTSSIENSTDAKYAKHKGLQFKRRITLYKASTRVKVEMTMLNKGQQQLQHGIWDITQTACGNNDCWAYFQRNPSSSLGGGKGFVQYMGESASAAAAAEAATQWKPDAAPGGIMGVQYLKKVGKIGADCKAGWICFNDRTTRYAYVKTFTWRNGETYPDSGASVQVYTYDDTYNMIEVEVLGPLVNLGPGDSTTLTEEWFAARASGTVLDINSAGLITRKLTVQEQNEGITVTGTYGVFQPGKVYARFIGTDGNPVSTADSFTVKPDDSLQMSGTYTVPPGVNRLQLQAYSTGGVLVGILDSAAVPVTGVRFDNRQKLLSAPLHTITPSGITLYEVEPATVTMHTLTGRILASHRVIPGDAMTVPFTGYRGTCIVTIARPSGTVSIPVPAVTVR